MTEVGSTKASSSSRRWLGNLVSFVVSIVVTYFVLGSVFLRFGPGLTPALSSQLPMAANLWWQPSAPDPSNEGYLALLGDSYAEGVGDWQAERIDFTSPSHSADVIADLAGRNVLSLGRRGAGSAEGLVRLPALALGAGDCFYFPALAQPQELVYYFYEGNDLEDNIEFMDERLGLSVGDPGVRRASINFLDQNWGDPGFKPCLLYFGKTIKTLTKTAGKTILPLLEADTDQPQAPPAPNRALIDGEMVNLPATLQGPGLGLDKQSISAAFEVFEVSLMWLQQAFPGIKITIVHLPSPLSTYNLLGPNVTVEAYDRSSTVHGYTEVASRSNQICRRLREITLGQGAGFVDARPALRELGTHKIIHGPRDWRHFDQAGYTRLGETVAAALDDQDASNECGYLTRVENPSIAPAAG